MQNPKHIVITGASSGIGAALALAYAAPDVMLGLHGRNGARLESVAALARARGAAVSAHAGDVTDKDAMTDWLQEREAARAVDLVIANAGISAGTGSGGEGQRQAEDIFAVNVGGVLNTVYAALPGMLARRRGQIALVSSLAGFRGLPGTPAYSASKAAVRLYGEALRNEFSGRGIEVSVICPGYVRTPMTAVNTFPMPFLMEPEKAAALIRRGLERNKSRIVFPLRLYSAVWALAMLPPGWTDWIMARLPKKP